MRYAQCVAMIKFLSVCKPRYGVNNVNTYLEPLSPSVEDLKSTQKCDTMTQPLCGPQIRTEVIERLSKELFLRAAKGAPSTFDPIEFGKDMAQQALGEAWGWFVKGENQTDDDLKRTAHWFLTNRLNDEYRKTQNRKVTQSIRALEQDAGVDALACLTTDEPLPDEVLNRADWASLVKQALARLSNPDYRKILELRFWHNMSNEQIADALGKCERTVIRWHIKAEGAFKTELRSLTDDVIN